MLVLPWHVNFVSLPGGGPVPYLAMNLISWDVGGLNRAPIHQEIRSLIGQFSLDLVGMIETKVRTCNLAYIKKPVCPSNWYDLANTMHCELARIRDANGHPIIQRFRLLIGTETRILFRIRNLIGSEIGTIYRIRFEDPNPVSNA